MSYNSIEHLSIGEIFMNEVKKHRLDWSEEQVQFLIENYGKLSTKEIAIHIGCDTNSTARIIAKARRLGLGGRAIKRVKLEEIPIEFNAQSIEKDVNGKIKVQCPYCKNFFMTKPSALARGHRKSCGCVNVAQRRGTEYVSSTYFAKVYQGALKRNIEFNISIDYASEILEKQKFKCALSGCELIYGYKSMKQITASIDRIDNTKGYIEGNIQWVHKFINIMKWDLKTEEFITLCKMVNNNHPHFKMLSSEQFSTRKFNVTFIPI